MSLKSFISANPFPSYEEALSAIEKHPTMSLAMYAEYGKPNHEALKNAYESGMDPKIVHKIGEFIYSLGGMQAMQMNYYAFATVAPFRYALDPDIRYAYKELEYGWDGVGYWAT